jgi:hypothetical protein
MIYYLQLLNHWYVSSKNQGYAIIWFLNKKWFQFFF